MRDNSGFTLIELIMTMLLISILAVYAAPKLDISLFRNTNFFLQAISSIRHAQKQAIASGCIVEVEINASECKLTWRSGASHCLATEINSPSNGTTNFCKDNAPSATPTGGNFRFDNIGRPMDTADNLLAVVQSIVIGDRTILVEAETGYTHEN